MKTSELRLGNIVFHSTTGDIEKISYIGHIKEIEGVESHCFYNPIPLTEKWLLKFGFRKADIETREIISLFFDSISDYWIHFRRDGGISFGVNGGEELMSRGVEYVHQLQNLYFALTGEELIIR